MGIEDLTPQLVGTCVDQEKNRRCQSNSKEFVQRVCRSGAMIGSRIDKFTRLSRGMDHAAQLITDFENKDTSFPSGLVIAAERLTGSQGRFGRYWHAPEGGLWMTLVLVNTLLPESARLLPLAAGVACCEAVRQYIPAASLKWVNDVHVNNRKLVGILAQTMIGPKHGEEYILLGIGVNVNNNQFPADLSDLAASLQSVSGAPVAVGRFAAELLAKLVWYIGLLNYHEQVYLRDTGTAQIDDVHPIISTWRQLSDTPGRRVLFGHNVQESPQYEATVRSILADGALLLDLADGSGEIIENSGELLYLD